MIGEPLGMYGKVSSTNGSQNLHFVAGRSGYEGDTPAMTILSGGDVEINDGNLIVQNGHGIDFSDTAAACVNMDLIITVDTAVAHLAGAIGCRTNLLLHYQSDWRWGLETKTSHWYPNMRLIRLQRNSEWSATYAEISTTIESIL